MRLHDSARVQFVGPCKQRAGFNRMELGFAQEYRDPWSADPLD